MPRRALNLWMVALAVGCGGGGGAKPDDGPSDPERVDGDGDGVSAAEGDCDDRDPAVVPGAPDPCDDVDNDCDGAVDEDGGGRFDDDDGDGFGGAPTARCDGPATGDDCDDLDDATFPGATEACDGVDNDCDGEVDEGAGGGGFLDADGDGFGQPGSGGAGCGTADNDWDCDDADPGTPALVGPGGGPSPDGSLAAPFPTVSEGLASGASCVLVAAGEYVEDLDLGHREVRLVALEGPASTTLRGTGAGPVVTISGGQTAATVLDGFTITGGTGLLRTTTAGADTLDCYHGGGIYVSGASPTLTDLVITQNVLAAFASAPNEEGGFDVTTSQGAAMYAEFGAPTLQYSYIEENEAVDGAVYAYGGGLFVTNSTIARNVGEYGGGLTSEGDLTLTNAIVQDNASGYGAGLLVYGSAQVTNSTVVGNDGAGIVADFGGRAVVWNTIVAFNEVGLFAASDGIDLGYSDVYGNDLDASGLSDTSGNLATEPMFTNWTDDGVDNDDLHLAPGSPLVDAGDPAAQHADPDGSRNDLGAYGGPGGDW